MILPNPLTILLKILFALFAQNIGQLMMTSFHYYDRNPSGFCFLVQISGFVIDTSRGLLN